MKVIRFTRGVPPYNTGEVAGFTDALADHYLKLGFARSESAPEPKSRRGAPAGPEPRFPYLDVMANDEGTVTK